MATVGALIENFLAIETSRAPSARLILQSGIQMSEKVLGLGAERMLKHKVITPEAQWSLRALTLIVSQRENVSFFIIYVFRLSQSCALINPCLHSVTVLQLFKLTQFCYLNF